MSVVLEILRWLIAIGLVYLFLIAPNILHRKLRRKELLGWYYAHRGLHGPGRAENSLEAFQAAIGLSPTGVADPDTQEYLYASTAPSAPTAQPMNAPAMGISAVRAISTPTSRA